MVDDCLDGAEFEAETIARALSGDAGAGREALLICEAGLCSNSLSETMRLYLAACLRAVGEGVGAERALNIEVQRRRGTPEQPSVAARNTWLAVWVKLASDRGMPRAVAKAEAGEFWDVANVDRVLRAVDVTAQDDDSGLWDEIFLAKGKPLPPRQ